MKGNLMGSRGTWEEQEPEICHPKRVLQEVLPSGAIRMCFLGLSTVVIWDQIVLYWVGGCPVLHRVVSLVRYSQQAGITHPPT